MQRGTCADFDSLQNKKITDNLTHMQKNQLVSCFRTTNLEYQYVGTHVVRYRVKTNPRCTNE